jgi:hypothetical protein
MGLRDKVTKTNLGNIFGSQKGESCLNVPGFYFSITQAQGEKNTITLTHMLWMNNGVK